MSEYLNDDEEQFYSAEEGDSSRSVTPERRRPESSSGEENSDIETLNREEATSLQPSVSNERINTVPNQRSCSNSNVSLIQEHDSIGPELEETARGSNHSIASASHKRVLSVGCTQDQKSPKRLKLRTSPFQPICSGHRQQRLIKQLSESLSPAKRKIPRDDDDEENASPNKKAFTESCSKRVRLGYFESSESEDDDVYRRGRSRRKKPKLSKIGIKTGRLGKQSAESSSEEDNCNRLKKSRESELDDKNSNLDEEDPETFQGKVDGGKVVNSKLSTKVHALQIGNGFSNSPQSQGRKILRARHISSAGSNNNAYSINSQSLGAEHEKYPEDVDHSPKVEGVDQPTVKLRSMRNVEASKCNLRASQSLGSEQGHGKMGDLGVRNAQGKVFPLHQFRSPVAPHSPPEPSLRGTCAPKKNDSASGAPNPAEKLSNISQRLRRGSGAFVLLDKLSPSLTKFIPQQQSKVKNGTKDANPSQHCNGDIDMQQQPESSILTPTLHNFASTKETLSENPFQNIELTPPSKMISDSLEGDTTQDQNAIHGHFTLDAMETNDPPTADDSSVATSPAAVETDFKRPIIRAKRRSLGKTMAERFHNFWTKKNVGPKLKSIFSKTPASQISKPNTVTLGNRAVHAFDHSSSNVNLLPHHNAPNTSAPVTFLSSDSTESQSSLPPSKSASQLLGDSPAVRHHTLPLLLSSSAQKSVDQQVQQLSPNHKDLFRPGEQALRAIANGKWVSYKFILSSD